MSWQMDPKFIPKYQMAFSISKEPSLLKLWSFSWHKKNVFLLTETLKPEGKLLWSIFSLYRMSRNYNQE